MIFLKQVKAPPWVNYFKAPSGYYTINKIGKNSSKYLGWIAKGLLRLRLSTKTVQQGFKITLYAGEYIMGAQKKSVAIYAIEEERL